MDTAGMKRFGSLALSLMLFACANTAKQPTPAPVAATATYGPASSVASEAPEPGPPPPPRPAPDQCGLDELRGTVGKSRLQIPIPIEPGRRQVICDTCPRTREFIAGRQTVLFDAKTGLVTSVSCG